MAKPNTLKLVEVCKVAPHPASPEDPPASPASLPLTFFDIRWLRFAPVTRLYFYETTISFDPKFISNLKASLSLALEHFLPLAANITWPQDSLKPILRYVKGDNVSLTIADSDADFFRLSNDGFLEVEEYHPLVPKLEVCDEKVAVIALQVTTFPNGGFSIGTSMHHAILDGKTSTSFVKSWAHICKNIGEGKLQLASTDSLPDQLKPFYDRTVIEDRADLGAIYSNEYLKKGGPDNRSLMYGERKFPPGSIRGTFEFTRADVETLRQNLIAKLEKKPGIIIPHVTTFILACGYTWVCIVKAEEVKAEKTRLVFSADCRPRLSPPVPANYFGNCIAGCIAIAETEGLFGEDGLVVAVNAIIEAIKNLEKGVLDGAENWVKRIWAVSSERILTLAGSHQFGVYETDFGWGRPKKVEIVSIDRTRAISFSDAKNGDVGAVVEVGLVLGKHDMEVFASLFAKGLKKL